MGVIAVLVASVLSCDSPKTLTKPVALGPVSSPNFHGQSRSAVIQSLGKPVHDLTYPMSEAVVEFRIALQNTYPLSNPANRNVEIQELWWRDGDYWITLWFHQVDGEWVVLASCRWHKNIAF